MYTIHEHTHTHTHTCTHTCTLAHAHTCILTVTHAHSHVHTQKQSSLATTEWSCAPGDPGRLCTKHAHRAGAVQSAGARARSSQEYWLYLPLQVWAPCSPTSTISGPWGTASALCSPVQDQAPVLQMGLVGWGYYFDGQKFSSCPGIEPVSSG